jgi:hypothetical protein
MENRKIAKIQTIGTDQYIELPVGYELEGDHAYLYQEDPSVKDYWLSLKPQEGIPYDKVDLVESYNKPRSEAYVLLEEYAHPIAEKIYLLAHSPDSPEACAWQADLTAWQKKFYMYNLLVRGGVFNFDKTHLLEDIGGYLEDHGVMVEVLQTRGLEPREDLHTVLKQAFEILDYFADGMFGVRS